MAIYRGDGGANEATDLATNQAAIAKQYAEQAADSATQSALVLDEFTDIYLGDFATEPVSDNDGNTLQVGALYFDTGEKLLKIWDGFNWLVSAVSEPSSFARNIFSGNGVQTVFLLSTTPVNNDSVFVFVGGVITTAYNVAGMNLTFTVAPANGTNNILAIVASTVSTLNPVDNSVSTAKLQEGAVTTSKIGDLQVTEAKIASLAVGTSKLQDASVTEAKINTGAVTVNKIGNGAVSTAKIADGSITGVKLEDITTSTTVGTTTKIPVITVDTKGRVTTLTDVTVNIPTVVTSSSDPTFVDSSNSAASTNWVNGRSLIGQGSLITTSGASFYDTTIPAGAKRLTILLNEVSTNSTSPLIIRLGNPSIVSTGYVSTSNNYNNSSGTSGTNDTTSFIINSVSAADIVSGRVTIELLSGSTYVSTHTVKLSSGNVASGGGSVVLGVGATVVRITTLSGSALFDAGSARVCWEF